MLSKGVTLIAIGRYGYLQWAVNMAVSLKFHSPDIAIQLITSKFLSPDAEIAQSKYSVFDVITEITDDEFMEDGKLFPAKLKTNFYKHLAFDATIYLDVDGCVIKDITPLFNIKSDFASDVQGFHYIAEGNDFNAMKWAKPYVVWEHFGLSEHARLPALNSSFVSIRKGELAESIFKKAHELLMTNPLPVEKHWHPWGQKRKSKNSQPDELYFNVALAVLNIIPEHTPAIHFRMVNEPGEGKPIEELAKGYYGIGLFGELRINHQSLREHYNKQMRIMWNQVCASKSGEPFHAKCEILSESKFVVQ